MKENEGNNILSPGVVKYGLIGYPLGHSYSKEIHEALGKYSYELYSLEHEDMLELLKLRSFIGLNVTIPYKKDVIPLCDEITPLARSIGAVNTLYREPADSGDSIEKQKIIGHNTDYEGFLYAAERAGIDFEGKTVLILGSGGTSLTTSKAAADNKAARIYRASRKKQEPDTLPAHITPVTYDELSEISTETDIIINTTPVGTYPNNLKRLISLRDFPNCSGVIDVIYNPFKTALLLEAEKLGIPYSNGLPMLVAQATAAAGFFTGMPGSFTSENDRIIATMQQQMENLVLTGMPGSGKTTIGRLLSKITGKKFVDMDSEIEKKAGTTIPEIFSEKGEDVFRNMESDVAANLGKERGLIIATGGGAVLRAENIDALRQNGKLIHIRRSVEKLAMGGRPLSSGLDALKAMEKKRMPVYCAAADAEYNNTDKSCLSEKKLRAFLDSLR